MPTAEERAKKIDALRALPARMRAVVAPLSEKQLTTAFIPGEWTVAQNVHHVADSHMHSYIRCKFMATAEHPTLQPYPQEVWAELPDASAAALESSLRLLEGLHARWAEFFEGLSEEDWARTGFHPENGDITLETQLDYYAAHGEGHIDQIKRTLAAQNK